MKTTELVESIVKDTVTALGYELCDVEFVKEYGDWVLTLFINKEGGVTIDDCETVSRAVDPVLDEKDPIAQQYYLSVSSLGIDRPLKKDADFQRNLGTELVVKLYMPLNGKKEYIGMLESFDGEKFTVVDEKAEQITFLRKDAALVKPNIRF